jgi:hypothetical protein
MRNSRRAKSLLEMVIIVSIMSVALTLSATTLVALFRVERQIRTSADHRQTIDRLSSRLRADAHAAVSAKTEGGCELSLPDGRTILYVFAAPAITREVRRGSEVLHRDAFVLAAKAQAAFSSDGEASDKLIRVSITPGELPQRRHQVAIRSVAIAAAVNLHRVMPAQEAVP